MKTFLCNAFSINMINDRADVTFVNVDEPTQFLVKGFESAVGHADTARVFSSILGMEVQANRINVVLDDENRLVVGQYKGPRLPEGATKLPEGAVIEWWLVYKT